MNWLTTAKKRTRQIGKNDKYRTNAHFKLASVSTNDAQNQPLSTQFKIENPESKSKNNISIDGNYTNIII
jgi:hypothetical protein